MDTTTDTHLLGKEITLRNRYNVQLTLKGASTHEGVLKSISDRTATLAMQGEFVPGTRCFFRLSLGNEELYSRAQVLTTDKGHLTLLLENGLALFRKLIRTNALSESSTLRQLIKTQSLNRILAEIKEHPTREKQRKLNCWEANQCGKEHYCAAGTSKRFDGLLGGRNGGRFCAFIDETLCKDGRPMANEKKLKHCAECSFFEELLREATSDFELRLPRVKSGTDTSGISYRC
ncbi:MAG: hypothetical protein HQL81_08620 [Magnetococcales bacterium]|nr:hypothetical protein [Magnetococcales bacterium]